MFDCIPEAEMSLGARMIAYTAVGAASALGLLGIIGVALLVRRLIKKGKGCDITHCLLKNNKPLYLCL